MQRPVALLLSGLLAACGGESPAPGGDQGHDDSPATPAASEPADAELVRKVEVHELRARATRGAGEHRLVNFWATWCGPCVEELPEIKAFAEAHPEVEVLLVNLDYPTLTRSHVEPFVKRHDLVDLQVMQLDHSDPAKAMGDVVAEWPYSIPFTMVVDPEGATAHSWNTAVTREEIEAVVASW